MFDRPSGAASVPRHRSRCCLRSPPSSRGRAREPLVVYLIAFSRRIRDVFGISRLHVSHSCTTHVPVFAGLRVLARLGIFVIAFLAILAAHGYATLHDAVPPAARRALAVVISCVLLLEYSVSPLQLVRLRKHSRHRYTSFWRGSRQESWQSFRCP